jgi:hypothetical protein
VNDQPIVSTSSGGDTPEARQLGEALKLLKEHGRDRHFSDLVDRVLGGRAPLRDLVRSPVVDRVVTPYAEAAVRDWRALSDTEREDILTKAREAQRDGAW